MFTQGHTASYGIWLTQEPVFLTTRLFVTTRPGSGHLLRVSGFATVEGPQVFIPAVSESSISHMLGSKQMLPRLFSPRVPDRTVSLVATAWLISRLGTQEVPMNVCPAKLT